LEVNNLASKAYDQFSTENTLQATETDIVSPRFINEMRFQFMRSNSQTTGDTRFRPSNVSGAFKRRRGADRQLGDAIEPAGVFQ